MLKTTNITFPFAELMQTRRRVLSWSCPPRHRDREFHPLAATELFPACSRQVTTRLLGKRLRKPKTVVLRSTRGKAATAGMVSPKTSPPTPQSRYPPSAATVQCFGC